VRPASSPQLSPGALRVIRLLKLGVATVLVFYGAVNAWQVLDSSTCYRDSSFDVPSGLLFVGLAAALYAPWTWLRVMAGYLGALLVTQALIAPLIRDFDYMAHQSDLREVIDVQGDGLPGISGMQRITTDQQGYRVSAPIDYDHPAGLRIFAIGGSTTEEILLDDRHTWTDLLGRELAAHLGRPVEMINTGVSGLRTPHHLATLKYISALHPDAAIFLIGANDWNCHIVRAVALGANPTVEPPWLLATRSFLRSISLKESLVGIATRNAARRFLYAIHPNAGGQPRTETGEYYARQARSLERRRKVHFTSDHVDPLYDFYLGRIIRTCKERRIKCSFVTQPTGYSRVADEAYRARFWMTPPDVDYTLDLASLESIADLYNRHLIAVGREHDVTVCDAASQFEPSLRYFFDDVHLNEAGAWHMAEVLESCLVTPLR
jgi:lysophospholipase L1-like esterase